MGRIKTTQVKRAAMKLVDEHKDKFTADFSKNKQVIKELADIPSKKLRNVVTGYITRLTKKQKE